MSSAEWIPPFGAEPLQVTDDDDMWLVTDSLGCVIAECYFEDDASAVAAALNHNAGHYLTSDRR